MRKFNDVEAHELAIEVTKFVSGVIRLADKFKVDRDDMFSCVIKTLHRMGKNTTFELFDVDSHMPTLEEVTKQREG